MESYWSRVLRQQVSRRSAIAATGATATAAALLAACGGGSSPGGSSGGPVTKGKKDASGLITAPEDTSKTAKQGGVSRWYTSTEPNHLDGQAQGQAQLNQFNGLAYSALVANKMGFKEPSTYSEVIPNMAESWELSPDRLQLTFKLRRGVKWHNKPPVSGRVFDSSDLAASWKRYEAGTGNTYANANSVNPFAPIISVTGPDPSTVVYKLKEPSSFLMQRLANMVTGELGTIYPREAGQGFDPRKDQIGTGGFVLDKWEPSVKMTYNRNPDYWDKNEPHVDRIEAPILPQYPTGLAALVAGDLHHFLVRSTDVVATKRQTPVLNMYQTLIATPNVGTTVGFGWLPWAPYPKSPFLDVRVRQAMSLCFDREAYIDTFFNVSGFEKEGLPVETYYHTAIGPVPGITLDPRDEKTFGPNAKYFIQDIAEAKKLLSAAGYASGIEYPAYFVSSGQLAGTYINETEAMNGWAREAGFRPQVKGLEYNLDYLPRFITQQGKHDGLLYRAGAQNSNDAVDYFVWRYWSKAGATSGALGFDVNGRGDGSGDPEVDTLIEKAKAETDAKKQIGYMQDLQRYLGKMQYGISRPGQASGFDLARPALSNFRVFYGDLRAANVSHLYTTWIDDTKAPNKKT